MSKINLNDYHYREIRQYILDSIDLEGYENQTLPESPILACYEIFKMEYGWRIKQPGMNEFSAFREWLRGRPCLTVDYTYFDERALIEDWRKHYPRKIDDDEWVDSTWWDLITTAFFKMKREAAEVAGLPAVFD